MELKMYLDILAKRWRIALIITAGMVVLFALASLFMHPDYQAEAMLRVATPLGGSSSDTNYQTTFATRLMNTYAQIGTSEEVMRQLKAALSVTALPSMSVTIVPDSEILQIVAEGNNPRTAVSAANGLADILASYDGGAEATADPEELAMLAQRKSDLAAQLTQLQQQHDMLSQTYAETAAQMAVMDTTLQTTQGSYQNLQNQYQLAVVASQVNPSMTTRATEDALAKQITDMQKELDVMNKQYEALSQSSSNYQQQITLVRQTIMSTQSAYSNLLSSYDNVSLARLKQQNAQKVIIVSRAAEALPTSGPGRGFVIGLGLVLGLIVGIAAAFILDTMGIQVRVGKTAL